MSKVNLPVKQVKNNKTKQRKKKKRKEKRESKGKTLVTYPVQNRKSAELHDEQSEKDFFFFFF